MKKTVLLAVLLVPVLMFGQVSNWRSEKKETTTQQPVQSTFQSKPQQQQQPNVSSWRSNPPVPQRVEDRRDNGNRRYDGYRRVYRYDPYRPYPYYGRYGWYNTDEIYSYDPYGYRYRQHVYIYEDGRQDTIKVTPTHFSLGIQLAKDKQLGGWLTVGNKGYFIVDFSSTIINDKSTYFPNGRLDQVDFPITGDVTRFNTVYAGFGKKIGKVGFHLMIGNINEDIRYQGKDALGTITFPKSKSNYLSAKFGILRDFDKGTLKLDYDPFTKVVTWGLGINF